MVQSTLRFALILQCRNNTLQQPGIFSLLGFTHRNIDVGNMTSIKGRLHLRCAARCCAALVR